VIDGTAQPNLPETRWQQAVVREVHHPTDRVVMLRLRLTDPIRHLAGQHYVVRLTADDGYTASRSYSVASAPGEELIELCIARLDDGEVSGYLAEVVEVGDPLDVRGPIGGWFVWDGRQPALAVGGGTGVVPLVAMARQARSSGDPSLLRLAASGRSMAALPYADELISYGATVALTRAIGPDGRPPHRLDAAQLEPLLPGVQRVYVCGSAVFAEALSSMIVGLGVPERDVRVERFGPTG
jgi:ferredoxin-NADP reductase